ncbi:MAG: hypothetical protein AB7G11_02885 [Phycisphaerales bacterium]
MRHALVRLAPIFHLTRVTTAFAAVANVWFVILWTRAAGTHEGAPASLRDHALWVLLVAGAVNAAGLSAYGSALNDVLDVRRDRTLNPRRPLPAGALSIEWAVVLVVATFMIAVVGASLMGMEAVLLTVVVAAAILFFNAAAKYIPAVGLVLLGLIYAGHMVVPNLYLRFVWPIWLVMSHSLAAGWLAHVVGRKVPRLSQRAVLMAFAGWGFWSAIMLITGWIRGRGEGGLWPNWVSPVAGVGPVALAALFSLVVWRKVRRAGRGARSGEKISRYGSLWLALYACAWLIGQGYRDGAIIMCVLAGAGVLGMTVLRELYSLIEQPVGYRA